MDTQKEYIQTLDNASPTRPVYGSVAELENEEALTERQMLGFLRDDVIALQSDVTVILSLLRPLAPALRALPEVVEQVGPIIDGIKKSPVLKALGVRLPT